MNIAWIIGIVLCCIMTIGVFSYALSASKNEKRMRDKLREIHSDPNELMDVIENKITIKDLPIIERTLNPYKDKFAKTARKMLPENFIKEIDQKILVAGNPKGMTTVSFLGDIGVKGTLLPAIFGVMVGIIMKNILMALGVAFGMSALVI